MSKQRKKRDLPTKICPACVRPFSWRKKWERNWEEVKFCSERCRRDAKLKRNYLQEAPHQEKKA